MRIHTHGLKDDTRVFARHLARKRIERVLGRTVRHLERITVRLGDLNGPRGGVDKFCAIDLTTRNGLNVRVRARHDDLQAAVQDAAGRARRSLYKALDRQRCVFRRAAP